MSRKPPDYFEPWEVRPARVAPPHPFPNGIPPEADPEAARALVAMFERADVTREWLVVGSRVVTPSVCVSLEGKAALTSGKWPIGSIGPIASSEAKPRHTAEEVARRAVACVNACRSIADPEATLEAVRGLLRDVIDGSAGPEDSRFLSLLGRMVRAEELPVHATYEDD